MINRPTRLELDQNWFMVISASGQYACAGDIAADSPRFPAIVPGTVARTLTAAGRFDPANPAKISDRDFWYLTSLEGERAGRAILCLDGLATIAEVYLNDELQLSSDSMFAVHEIPVRLTGKDNLAICFRALDPHLAQTGPRARWRPQMITPSGMRLVRSTLLGHMPGWCPDIDAVGPYRPISIRREGDYLIDDLRISSGLGDDGEGLLDISFVFSGKVGDLKITCGGETTPVMISEDGRLHAHLAIPSIKPWWPQSHGDPDLYDIWLHLDGYDHLLGRTGFRNIAIDRDEDGQGFAIRVNGVNIFCRGAVWTNADITSLPGDRESYSGFLELAALAGMNMIRIGGTMTYETPEFYALCDELGLMVWQDFMLANFDYPASDPAFCDRIAAEAESLLKRLQGAPSLVVLCGGSEIYQQAAMLGLPRKFWAGPLTEEILPGVAEALRPDVIYIPNTPFGGDMPFLPNTAVSHYYGVGAYCRPLDDARRANVRFAAECLAFANVPEQASLDNCLAVPAVHDPRWKARVPRDRGASWDFEDIRDHYLAELYAVDVMRLRREDPARYLDLSRAASGEVMQATFSEWRHPKSSCRGAMVWTLQDLLPGAGWGVIDSTGLPKPAWHALKRAFQSLQVILTDEGTNGLYVHLVNEHDRGIDLTLDIAALRDGSQVAVSGTKALLLAARSSLSLAATDLFGAFFDTTYAYRFGPPAHDVTIASITIDGQSQPLSQAFHFPRGRAAAFHDARLEASLQRDDDGWFIDISTDRLAQSVHLAFENHLPSDNWFHLAPGSPRRIELAPIRGADPDTHPVGEISSLSGRQVIRL